MEENAGTRALKTNINTGPKLITKDFNIPITVYHGVGHMALHMEIAEGSDSNGNKLNFSAAIDYSFIQCRMTSQDGTYVTVEIDGMQILNALGAMGAETLQGMNKALEEHIKDYCDDDLGV